MASSPAPPARSFLNLPPEIRSTILELCNDGPLTLVPTYISRRLVLAMPSLSHLLRVSRQLRAETISAVTKASCNNHRLLHCSKSLESGDGRPLGLRYVLSHVQSQNLLDCVSTLVSSCHVEEDIRHLKVLLPKLRTIEFLEPFGRSYQHITCRRDHRIPYPALTSSHFDRTIVASVLKRFRTCADAPETGDVLKDLLICFSIVIDMEFRNSTSGVPPIDDVRLIIDICIEDGVGRVAGKWLEGEHVGEPGGCERIAATTKTFNDLSEKCQEIMADRTRRLDRMRRLGTQRVGSQAYPASSVSGG